MTTPLQKAAQALIERWDSPAWKDQPHTANYIAELRKALDAEIAQAVEPVAVFNGLVDSGEHGAFNLDMLKMIPRGAPLYLHPPQPQATTAVPSGERADSAQWLREFADMEFSYYSREATQLRKAADMLEADAQPKDKGPWCAGMTKDARVYVQSDDFKRDARLYVNGDFATKNEEYLYACALARHLNATAETMSANSQQAKQVPMTLDEIEKLWIESGRDIPYMEFKDAVQMTEANHGITQADNPADDESEDLYALALKADNLGQP